MVPDLELRPNRLFGNVNNFTCFEIWSCPDPTNRIIRTTHISGDNTAALEDLILRIRGENAYEGIVVFFSEKETVSSDTDPHKSLMTDRPFQMTYDSFQVLVNEFQLPKSQLEIYGEASTVFLDFGSELASTRNESQHFVMQNSSTTTSQFSAGFSFNPNNLLTVALIHGLSNSEITKLSNDLVDFQHCVSVPMLVPISLLKFRVESATTKVRYSHDEIWDIEHKTGIRTKWHPGKPCCDLHAHPRTEDFALYERINFNKFTEDLTSFTAKLAFIEYLCDVHLPMLDAFDSNIDRLLRILPRDDRSRFESAACTLTSEIKRLRGSLQCTRCRAVYLSKRGQGLIQTIYSLIAQKDNALSMRDNAALKKISEDQKHIALIATRDSAAMRVVSVITMVFLPATFTATFFSTSFFNFQPEIDSESVVSSWIWLYFVATFGLSALILGWWFLSSRPYLFKDDGEFRELLVRTQPNGSPKSATQQARKSPTKQSAV